MHTELGVWVDHSKAVVAAKNGEVQTIASGLEGHTRYAGSGGRPGGDASQTGGSEKGFEERFRQQLDRYYDRVIAALGEPEALLIFGPGEAKQQLRARLSRSKRQPRPTIELESADTLTDRQIVAKVGEHFRVVR
jgi:hypothetical protein